MMDFISADILKLAANYASAFKDTIGLEDLKVAINADQLMQKLFRSVEKLPVVDLKQRITMSYPETVREMLAAETQCVCLLACVLACLLSLPGRHSASTPAVPDRPPPPIPLLEVPSGSCRHGCPLCFVGY